MAPQDPNLPIDPDAELWRRTQSDSTDTEPVAPIELAGWLDGRLDAPEADAFEGRLAEDPDGRAAAADVRAIDFATARQLLVPSTILSAACDLVPGGRAREQAPVIRVLRWAVAVAAIVAVCIAGFRAGQSTPTRSATEALLADASFGLLTEDELTDDFTYELLLATIAEDQT